MCSVFTITTNTNTMVTITLVIVMGPSATGKTSIAEGWAQRHGIEYIEGDHLHPADNIAKMAAGVPLNDDDRWPWLSAIRDRCSAMGAQLKSSCGGGKQFIVVTCSALKRSYRDHLRQVHNIDRVRFVFPVLDYELVRRRIEARRGHYMKANMLDSQLRTLETPDEGSEPDVIFVQGDQPIDNILDHLQSVL